MNWAELAALLPAPATISGEAYEGSGAFGDTYAAAANISPCVIEHTRRRVRAPSTTTENTAGDEVISSTTVYAPPDTVLPPGSRVTLPDGRVTRVIVSSLLTAAGLPLPEHVELSLE